MPTIKNDRQESLLINVQKYFLYFMMYSVIGWIYEVFLEVVVYQWGFSNRGVLFGPYCVIYGTGAMAFLLCFHKIMIKKTPSWFKFVKPFIIFAGCMAVATAIELISSYLLEALTGSWPWQTYVDYSVNFQGRIALSPSIRFGLGGMLFLYVLQPIFEKLVGKLENNKLKLVFWPVFIIIFIDFIFYIITNFLVK